MTAGSEPHDLVEPGKQTFDMPESVMQVWDEAMPKGVYTRLRVGIHFTDAAGRRWWRDEKGVLTHRLPDPPAKARET